jgi:2-polyprenyl-3-methyl-5-hydroxy-6-metoxy-1,4-benzoquinol methylase
MDDLQCKGEVVNQTLRELETINKWLGGNAVTINGVHKLLRHVDQKNVITIADLGCGGGDMLRRLKNWGEKNNYQFSMTGIDANPNIIAFATRNTSDVRDATFVTQNIFSEKFRALKFDIILGTLFFHHFTSEQLVEFLKQVKNQAQIGIIINDIHRHWLAYYSIRLLTRIFSKSSMVQYDAPLSVLRAFSKTELLDILSKAGITTFRLRWKWAFRWQLVISTLDHSKRTLA